MNVNAFRDGRRSSTTLLSIVVLLTLVSGCELRDGAPSDASQKPAPRGKTSVVATYSILGDWTIRVGGPRIHVDVLVGPGGDAHTYEPTPVDGVALERASLIFENGFGFETWLDDLYQSSRSTARRCVVTQGIEPRAAGDASSGRVELDPHVWHSPRRVVRVIRNIADQLATADPDHASDYRARAADYILQLERLDADIRRQLEGVPAERRVLVTTHDTFGYFAEDYGFRVLSILGSTTSETSDPSAKEVAEVIRLIRDSRTRAVFTENILNPKLTEQIAKEAGVTVVPSLYTDALAAPGSEGGDYLSMMRANVRTIVESLQ